MTATTDQIHNKDSGHSSRGRRVAKYVLLPGIIPQIKELTRGGFGYLAFLIALVYQAVRILPANHPYGQYKNIGKFGIRQVVAMAANNVKFTKANIDQIIVFFAIIAALIILVLQFVGFILLLISGNAWANDIDPNSFGGIFATQNQETDIAFRMMRQVFGIPGFFGDLEGAAGGADGRTSLHIALQGMFQFYNLAILIVAILVFVYYIIVVVGETATTGTPFGQRFSHIYAPIRLVLAIGLLVPLNYGFNGAQYLTFYAAKLGSGFATTGWTQFNKSLEDSNPLGADNATLIAKPQNPDVTALVQFMSMVVTCREAYALNEQKNIEGIVKYDRPGYRYLPFNVNTLNTLISDGWNENIEIQFGSVKTDPNAASSSSEIPEAADYNAECGTIQVPVNLALKDTGTSFYPGQLQKNYYLQVRSLWVNSDLKDLGEMFAKKFALRASAHSDDIVNICNGNAACEPDSELKDAALSKARIMLDNVITQYDAAKRAALETDNKIREETLALGWGGAGIWYNRIAQINGAYVVAVRNLPDPKLMPAVMEKVAEHKRQNAITVKGCERFEPNLAGDKAIKFDNGTTDEYYAKVFNSAYQYWCEDKKEETNNFVLDIMSAIFGLDGLMTIRDTVDVAVEGGEEGETRTIEIHPLAKLSALGKGLIESAIRNMTFGVASAFIGGVASSTPFGAAFQAFTSMFVSIATIALSIGFITFYILPFLPFIYFFFALGNWVKGIFEAMCGAPLWALAHLRIDGDGLPGKNAVNGYLLLFEIFLRPILTVFGLIGGMAIFAALAAIINEIFNIVVRVGVGVDLAAEGESAISMHTVDIFFFTCVYAVILYMMATASFKMINLVPNSILRWFGNNVTSFSDGQPDPTDGLVQYAAIGGGKIGGQLAQGITQGAQGVGSVIGVPFGLAANAGKPAGGAN